MSAAKQRCSSSEAEAMEDSSAFCWDRSALSAPTMRIVLCLLFIRGIITSTGPDGVTPPNVATVAVSSVLLRVLDLERSAGFYCEVFGCTIAVEDAEAALLLTPDGFQIYLFADPSSTPRSLGALGVREVMWAASTEEALGEVGDRMRRRYPSTFVHSANGVSFVDGRDPDGNRVLVAYPSPLQLPRHAIADRFR